MAEVLEKAQRRARLSRQFLPFSQEQKLQPPGGGRGVQAAPGRGVWEEGMDPWQVLF